MNLLCMLIGSYTSVSFSPNYRFPTFSLGMNLLLLAKFLFLRKPVLFVRFWLVWGFFCYIALYLP